MLPSLVSQLILATVLAMTVSRSCAQPLNKKQNYTHQDSLRGSMNPERAWWDVTKYKIFVEPDYDNKKIKGTVTIVYRVKSNPSKLRMQIDLQDPMMIDGIMALDGAMGKPNANNSPGTQHPLGRHLKFTREGNVFHVEDAPMKEGLDSIIIMFYGSPRVAVNPPWDGGWIFTKDAKDRPWMSVACQGLGASVWYPCKDYQGDEPNDGAELKMTVPKELVAVANGRLISQTTENTKATYTWEVKNPINNYNLIPYIGYYKHWSDSFESEAGKPLSLDFWVLDYDMEKAQKQFGRDVKPMLKCFEYWMGPYPFIEDGYKLVEAPHLGMEHQSAVAYGNKFMDGYLGHDLSGTGWGMKWDYIIVHESGHEWFANNVTTNDIADMWVHEGFTDYSEVLFVECQSGKQAADEYCIGLRKGIRNDKPVIGPYGVNQEGSGDMYPKGANLLHTIRQVIDNDELFRGILRGLNKTFWHQTIDSKDVEQYMSAQSKKDLSKIFDQYLRTVKIPELQYKVNGTNIDYRWANCVDGFNMPVKMEVGNEWIQPTTNWQSMKGTEALVKDFAVKKTFYIKVTRTN